MADFKETVVSTRAGTSPLKPMTADESFAYATTRALTFWPQTNANNAAWLENDFGNTKGLSSFVGTDGGFKFGLANIFHSVGEGKTNQVIGSIRDEVLIPGVGVDIMAQIDKRSCEAYEIAAEDFIDGDFNAVSVEIFCAREQSTFAALTNPSSKNLEDQTLFTAEQADAAGVRRTKWSEPDPYLYNGKTVVVEICSPKRCRGIAFVPNPADKTANVFEVAASIEEAAAKEPYGNVNYADPGFRGGKKRYPVDSEEHVKAAASYFGVAANRDKYTAAQREHIDNAIAAAKKKFNIGEENSGFSLADSPSLSSMMTSYDDVDPVDVGAATDEGMPEGAFADSFFDPEEDCSQRQYPLYASAEDHAKGKPHKGLVKAALQAHAAGKMKNPGLALQRLQVAHSQLHGAKSMDDKEKLANEVAELKTKLAEVQASNEEKASAIAAKDGEVTTLTAQLKELAEEKASLEAKIAAKESEEKANVRLGKLTEIDGFAVKDEEKAALIEALKTEDELAFDNRVLKAKIASMEEANKKVAAEKTAAEEKAAEEKRASEEAAAEQGLDFTPKAFKPDSKVNVSELF